MFFEEHSGGICFQMIVLDSCCSILLGPSPISPLPLWFMGNRNFTYLVTTAITDRRIKIKWFFQDLFICCDTCIFQRQELLSCVFFFFQQSFEILNEDDAAFILKVTQTLTDALVEYRQQAASKKVMRFWFFKSIDPCDKAFLLLQIIYL